MVHFTIEIIFLWACWNWAYLVYPLSIYLKRAILK